MIRGSPMKHCLLLAVVSGLSALASVAEAAEPAMVSRIGGGNVTWQHGDGSAKPRVQTLLAPGDVIAAGKGSFVEVEYLADKCKVRVEAGGSVVVSASSPCAAKTAQKVPPKDAQVVPAAAGAVEVSEKSGPVTQVNTGNGLTDAKVGDALKIGDEVFAGSKSSVTLYFAASNCAYTVPAGTVFKVTDKVPCEAPAAAQNGETPPLPEGVPTGLLLGGGALAAGGALVVIISNSEDDNGNKATPD